MIKGNIAFLVMAHTDPEMVARLSRRLLPYGRVFVHVDGKQPLTPFKAAASEKVAFVEPRTRVSWGGYTQVRAILDLMGEALHKMPEAEIVMLLSGQDYPIGSLDDFVAMLESRPGHNFIRGFDLLASPTDRNKIEVKRYLDDLVPFAPQGVLRRPVRFINRLGRKIDRETMRFRSREFPFDMKPATGSSWWVLTRPMAEYILRFVAENPAFVRYYRRAFAMDEQFFHTIALNSPLAAEHADPIEPYVEQQIAHMANVHHIHISLGKTYRLEDLSEVVGSGKWFIRKVSTEESTPLLDRLDALAEVKP